MKPFKAARLIYLAFVSAILCAAVCGYSATVSPLLNQGYTVIPEPQRVALSGRDFQLGGDWQLDLGHGVDPADVAVESLREGLKSRWSVALATHRSGDAKVLRLAILTKALDIGEAVDRDRDRLAGQAYKIDLAPDHIDVTASTSTGLFYGVQTLVQLVRPRKGGLWLPEGQIVDWPDVQFRAIFWNDMDHLDHLDVLKDAVRQASFYKINAFTLKLNGHFQFKSAPALVEPYALTAAQFQELTDYALRYHVQLVPYLDGPAHLEWVLSHPEYAHLQEFPGEEIEMCATNPESYKLLTGMYQELLDANKGVNYFHSSTDENFLIGLADNSQCPEAKRAKELGSPGRLEAEFLVKTAGYLHDRGRTPIFWGEAPLQVADIPALPKFLVNGEVYGRDYDKAFRANGIRQMIYSYPQGWEHLFPPYYVLSSSEQVHPGSVNEDRIVTMFRAVSYGSARHNADLMGVNVFAWSDHGLHPETFWLGFVTGAATGWHPGSPDPYESMSTFYPLFYGPGTTQMGRVYQLMATQAQFWETSWDTIPWGDKPEFSGSWGIPPSAEHIEPPSPKHIETLPLPPVPAPQYLVLKPGWTQAADNARRVQLIPQALAENSELLNLLHENLQHVEFNRYNLEVFLSIAHLYRQNLLMLQDLALMNESLEAAQTVASKLQYADAVAALDQALDRALGIRDARNQALGEATEVWYKSWFPRVREANGRRYVGSDLSLGLKYLIEREFTLPLGDWVSQVQAVRNQYASAHGVSARNQSFDWQDTTTLQAQETNPMYSRYGVTLGSERSGNVVRLVVRPDAVQIGKATDVNKTSVAGQTYKLDLAKTGITITANAPVGLYYCVQTLVQLVSPSPGALWLPEGHIVDWPDLGL
jgi:hypothetical protein